MTAGSHLLSELYPCQLELMLSYQREFHRMILELFSHKIIDLGLQKLLFQAVLVALKLLVKLEHHLMDFGVHFGISSFVLDL